jgi:hypothetical protein
LSLDVVEKHLMTEYYSDMMIQYGFVTMYAAVFPLAAVCVVVRNLITMRHLAGKFTTKWTRPVAERAQDIGIYNGILRFISFLAIIVNAIIVATETHFIPGMTHSYYFQGDTSYVEFTLAEFPHPENINTTCRADFRMSRGHVAPTWRDVNEIVGLYFILSFVLVMNILARLIDCVPDIPEEENVDLLKESYLAQKALRKYLVRGSSTCQQSLHDGDVRRKTKSLLGIIEYTDQAESPRYYFSPVNSHSGCPIIAQTCSEPIIIYKH